MAEYAPHNIYFDKANKCSRFRKIVFITSLILSFILTFISTIYKQMNLSFINNLVLILSLVILFIVENDEIDEGLYKLIINLFESCFWSLEVSKRMKDKESIKTYIMGIVLILISMYGLGNSLIAIPILQIFLSKDVVARYLAIKNYNSELNNIFDEIKSLFVDNRNASSEVTNQEHKIIDILLRYECNIEGSKVNLESKLFTSKKEKYKLEHQELERKWNNIKTKYNIR